MTTVSGWKEKFLTALQSGARQTKDPKAVGESAGRVFGDMIGELLTDDIARERLFAVLEGFARLKPDSPPSFDVVVGEEPNAITLSVRRDDHEQGKVEIGVNLPKSAPLKSKDQETPRELGRLERALSVASANLTLAQMAYEYEALVTSGYNSHAGRFDALSSGLLAGLRSSLERNAGLPTVFGEVTYAEYDHHRNLTLHVVGPRSCDNDEKPQVSGARSRTKAVDKSATKAGDKAKPAAGKAKAAAAHPWDQPMARGRAARARDGARYTRIAGDLAEDVKVWLTTPGALDAYGRAFGRVGMKIGASGHSHGNASQDVQTSFGPGFVGRSYEGLEFGVGERSYGRDQLMLPEDLEALIAGAVALDPSLALPKRLFTRLAALDHASWEQKSKLGEKMTATLRPVLDDLGLNDATVNVRFGYLSICIPVAAEVIQKKLGPV